MFTRSASLKLIKSEMWLMLPSSLFMNLELFSVLMSYVLRSLFASRIPFICWWHLSNYLLEFLWLLRESPEPMAILSLSYYELHILLLEDRASSTIMLYFLFSDLDTKSCGEESLFWILTWCIFVLRSIDKLFAIDRGEFVIDRRKFMNPFVSSGSLLASILSAVHSKIG